MEAGVMLSAIARHARLALENVALGGAVSWNVPWPRPRHPTPDVPIDVVYTWVDGSDPAWAAERARHRGEAGLSARRYRANDELRYSLRSIAENLPFVRRIFVVTCGHVPSWARTDHPRLTFVSHAEIYEDASHLPTFNSDSIEQQLWRIPGLSEHFLYFNDDILVTAPLGRADFMDQAGRPKVFLLRMGLGSRKIRARAARGDVHAQGILCSNALLDRAYGPAERRVDRMAPLLQRRSVHQEIATLFGEERTWTSAQRFRHPRALKLPFIVYPHVLLATGRGVEAHISWASLFLTDDAARNEAAFDLAARVRPSMLCLMDEMDDPSPRCLFGARRAMERLFPVSSPFEADAARC
jgi:hypothetical protein